MIKIIRRRAGRILNQPPDTGIIKTFHVKSNKRLSSVAKLVLNNLGNKYLYHAIEDIFSLLKSRPLERDEILAIIYSPVLSLQNHFSINFFNIWIEEIYISETSKFNKFLDKKSTVSESFNYVTIKFFYTITPPTTKVETFW